MLPIVGAVLSGVGRVAAAGAARGGVGRLAAFRAGYSFGEKSEEKSKDQLQENPQQQMPKGYV